MRAELYKRDGSRVTVTKVKSPPPHQLHYIDPKELIVACRERDRLATAESTLPVLKFDLIGIGTVLLTIIDGTWLDTHEPVATYVEVNIP